MSVAKAARAAGCLRHLAIVSPNQAELRAMALAAGFPELHGACQAGPPLRVATPVPARGCRRSHPQPVLARMFMMAPYGLQRHMRAC